MGKRSGIMLCYPFEEKRLAKWNPPYLVQPKLDGERCRAETIFSDDWVLSSSESNTFVSVPHIKNALANQNIPIHIELDGELYTHGFNFSEIHSRVSRTVNLHSDHEAIGYHIFDYIDPYTPQHQRTKYLMSLELKPPLFVVPTVAAVSLEDVMRAYDLFTDQDYEGIVIRHIDNIYIRKRSTFMMKFKPKKSDYYTIVGYKEEVSKDGKPKNRLGSLICVGDQGNEFSVGSGLDDDLREDLWKKRETLNGRICHVSYQHITSGKGVPRFPVFVSIEDGWEDWKGIKDFNPLI